MFRRRGGYHGRGQQPEPSRRFTPFPSDDADAEEELEAENPDVGIVHRLAPDLGPRPRGRSVWPAPPPKPKAPAYNSYGRFDPGRYEEHSPEWNLAMIRFLLDMKRHGHGINELVLDRVRKDCHCLESRHMRITRVQKSPPTAKRSSEPCPEGEDAEEHAARHIETRSEVNRMNDGNSTLFSCALPARTALCANQ